MTTLSHSNTWLHRMLTDQGAFVHEHSPEDFEDVGDAESGPQLAGGPAFDRYSGESHEIIVDHTGQMVAVMAIDWDQYRWIDQMMEQNGSDQEWPELRGYVHKRHAGENWQVYFLDEDGSWWAGHGGSWTTDPTQARFCTLTHAEQIASAHDRCRWSNDRIVGAARIIERKPNE